MKCDLWNEFISVENWTMALGNAVRGKRNKSAVIKFMKNADENLEHIRQSVIRGEFKTSEYKTMEITDPKRRTIYILPFACASCVNECFGTHLDPAVYP